MRRGLALLAALVLLVSCIAWEALAEDNVQMGRTEPLYSQAQAGYTLPVYGKEAVGFETDLTLAVGDSAQVDFSVPEDGQYEIWLTYQNTTQSMLPTELILRVDGELPFYELRRVKLNSLWVVDSDEIPVDRYGNEIAPTPVSAQVGQSVGVTDSTTRIDTPFLFELKAGSHTLALECQDSGTHISAVTLKGPDALPAYAGEKAQGSGMIVIEGEDIYSRSKSSIRGAGEFNAVLTPYSIDHRVLNHLDGASFDTAGDTVTYAFKAEKAGWYNLDFHYRQSVKADFPVFFDLLIDGAMPSEAAKQIHMDYSTSFTDMTVMSGSAPQTFYLSEGEHTLSLRINAAPLTPVYEMIDRVLSEINTLSLEITRLSGGKADQYRNYNVREYIPDIEDRLNGWSRDCAAAVDYIKQFSSNGSGSAFSSLTLCADQLRRLAEKPEDLPRRLSELSTGSNSASRMLAQQLQDMANNDVAIDQIIFYQEEAQLPSRAGFMESAGKSVERFVTSFSSQDYAAGTGENGHLQVWMGRSRQYVELVQNLIDMQFTPQTGIRVDISLMPDANKLVLANAAGTAPDVVLSLQYVVPSYLNIRGALYDLTQFEDFGEVAQRFSSGLFIPYTLGDGVYAMPETVNFWVMFYRKDILDALSIQVPDSMEEVKLILPELQRRNMNFYFPTAGMSGMKVFPGTLPLILQSGGSIYADTVSDTTLDSDESLKGFREMTELFTVYNMPTDVPSPGFYQQFRDGTLPI
ncbi:MAG: extracellular solute-binding protein, partial [Clostridia bacterium]|nr:extracellular solute-binding protein [Clostridia bacterium]